MITHNQQAQIRLYRPLLGPKWSLSLASKASLYTSIIFEQCVFIQYVYVHMCCLTHCFHRNYFHIFKWLLYCRLIGSSPFFPVSLIGWGQIRRGVTITPTVDDDWGGKKTGRHYSNAPISWTSQPSHSSWLFLVVFLFLFFFHKEGGSEQNRTCLKIFKDASSLCCSSSVVKVRGQV